MGFTQEDIARLRKELLDDLETLNRFEALLKKRAIAHPDLKPSNFLADVESPDRLKEVQLGMAGISANPKGLLKNLVIEAIKTSPSGMRPKEVVQAVKVGGYNFNSEASAAASVSTALQRLVESRLIRKEEGGLYKWAKESDLHRQTA